MNKYVLKLVFVRSDKLRNLENNCLYTGITILYDVISKYSVTGVLGGFRGSLEDNCDIISTFIAWY